QQRGHTLSERHDVRGIVDGHDFPVTPHRRLAACELVPRHLRADALQIVARKEHLAAPGAEVVEGVGRVLSVAVGAFEVAQMPHWTGPPLNEKARAAGADLQLPGIIPYRAAVGNTQILSTLFEDHFDSVPQKALQP